MVFRFHYGLWFGGLVGILPFLFNYATTYSNATATQQGVLFTILPFIALVAKPLVCSIADKNALHHQCLIFFIFLTAVGYGSLAIYPLMPQWAATHKDCIWILYCLATLVGNTSMCIVNSIGDSLAVESAERKGTNYGNYRMFGPIGWGAFGIIWGVTQQISGGAPVYVPGIISLVVVLAINILVLALWTDKREFRIELEQAPTTTIYGTQARFGTELEQDAGDRTRIRAIDKVRKLKRVKLLWRLGREYKSIYIYLMLFALCGLLTTIHWQFFFKFLSNLAENTEPKVSFLFLASSVLAVQSFGGELVFFFLASTILNKLGAGITLVLCLLSFAARYLLYAYVVPTVSIYWVLPVELFQGPAFGLMYCALTAQAQRYSAKMDAIIAADEALDDDILLKKSLHATLQGILGASFEGLGQGLGALISGKMFDANPIFLWKFSGFLALASAFVYLLGYTVSRRITARQRRTRAATPEQQHQHIESGASLPPLSSPSTSQS